MKKLFSKIFAAIGLMLVLGCFAGVVEADDLQTKNAECNSEACQLLAKSGIHYPFDYSQVDFEWTWFILDSIASAEDSADGSFTRYKGKTMYGTSFDVYVLWWLDQAPVRPSGCRKWIVKNGNYNPKKKKHYHFSGGIISRPATHFMTDVGCSFMNPKKRKKGYR